MNIQHINLSKSFQGILCICGRCSRKEMGFEGLWVCPWRLNKNCWGRSLTQSSLCFKALKCNQRCCLLFFFLIKESYLNIHNFFFQSDKGKPAFFCTCTGCNSTAENKARLCVGVQQHCSIEAKQKIWSWMLSPKGILGNFFLSLCCCLRAGQLHLNRI